MTDYDIPPYLLGLFLGGFRGSFLYIPAEAERARRVKARVEDAGWRVYFRPCQSHRGLYKLQLLPPKGQPPLLNRLAEWGILDDPHIPEELKDDRPLVEQGREDAQ